MKSGDGTSCICRPIFKYARQVLGDYVSKAWTMRPEWVDHLFALRNKIVGRFGLKTGGAVNSRQQLFDNFTCEAETKLGLFKVSAKNEQEVVLG